MVASNSDNTQKQKSADEQIHSIKDKLSSLENDLLPELNSLIKNGKEDDTLKKDADSDSSELLTKNKSNITESGKEEVVSEQDASVVNDEEDTPTTKNDGDAGIIDYLRKRLNDMIVENRVLNEKIEMIQNEASLKGGTVDEQYKRVFEKQKMLFKAEEDLRIKQEEVARYEAKLKVKEESLNKIHEMNLKEIKTLKDDLKKRNSEISARQLELGEKERLFDNKMKKMEELKREIEEKQVELNLRAREIEEKEKKLFEAQKEFNQKKFDFDHFVNQKSAEIHDISSQLALKEETLNTKEQYLEKYEERINSERDNVESLRKDVSSKREELKQKEQTIKKEIVMLLQKIKDEYSALSSMKNANASNQPNSQQNGTK